MKDHRRLNVALTRAQKQLIVVGDPDTLGQTLEGEDNLVQGAVDEYTSLEDGLSTTASNTKKPSTTKNWWAEWLRTGGAHWLARADLERKGQDTNWSDWAKEVRTKGECSDQTSAQLRALGVRPTGVVPVAPVVQDGGGSGVADVTASFSSMNL